MGQNTQYPETAAVAADPDFLRHELANVLHGLAGMTRLLKSSRGDADHRHWCEAIEEAASQACALLTADARLVRPERQRIDGPSLLESVVRAHTPAALEKGLRLSLVTARGVGRRWCVDAGLLRQVLDNLLANAVKFYEAGDVALIVRPGFAGRVFLHVLDQGPGVPPGDRRMVFRPGHRAQPCADRPGSGIGLAVCQRNVSLLGGRIRCTGRPNQGSCFSVDLPSVLEAEDVFSCSLPALASVRYRLDVEPSLDGFLHCLLESLGIGEWRPGRKPSSGPDRRLLVTISEVQNPPGRGGPQLVLRADCPVTEPVRLAAPLLPSRLRRGLLQLALAWRWSGVSRGAATG